MYSIYLSTSDLWSFILSFPINMNLAVYRKALAVLMTSLTMLPESKKKKNSCYKNIRDISCFIKKNIRCITKNIYHRCIAWIFIPLVER